MSYILEYLSLPSKKCGYDYNLPYLLFIPRSDCHFVPAIYYILDESLPTMIISHGNGNQLSDFDIKTMTYNFNANIIIYDYSSYGLHTCKEPGEYNCHLDILAVYNFLINNNVHNIILYGYSIGTGVTCNFAYYLSKKDIYPKLILVSAFKSIWNALLFIPLPFDIFKTHMIARYLKNVTLFIHGFNDGVCIYNQTKELSKSFPNVYHFYTICNCGHNGIIDRYEHNDQVKQFVNI